MQKSLATYILSSLSLWLFMQPEPVHAKVIDSHVKSRNELTYDLVFFEFFQNQFFESLVENACAVAESNPLALNQDGKLLEGGMMLSYGMADKSREIFENLLKQHPSDLVKNRAWYYLAKFYYNKSDFANASANLDNISGAIPHDLNFDYHYLRTLVAGRSGKTLELGPTADKLLAQSPRYPYYLFNLGITQLRQGDVANAVDKLERVVSYASTGDEYAVLADRAKLGLAQIAIRTQRMDVAWNYLTQIRSTGLYSNRALLNYAWAAIKIKRFSDATAALQVLDQRSIALPEVQEAKVLLAHLYEQEGSPRKALKANLLAIKDFQKGVAMVAEARDIIAKKDVPEEFVTNLEAIMDDSDWNSATPNVDYVNLTPFLIDLMASNPFHETLLELADLYSLRQNLLYWLNQANEHLIVMDNATKKSFDERSRQFVENSESLKDRFAEKKSDLALMKLTLDESDQDRMTILLNSTNDELAQLDDKVKLFKSLEKVYVLPSSYKPEVKKLHQRIKILLQKTELGIVKLEPIMRNLVNAELDRHEERMNYYWAQSRLAKARLYDTTLSTLKDAQRDLNEDE